MNAPETSRTVDAALQYAELLVDLGTSHLADLIQVTGEPATTALRRLRSLEQHALTRRLSDGQWTLGPALLFLASRTAHPLISVSSEAVSELAEHVSGAVVLASPAPPYFEVILEETSLPGGGTRLEPSVGVRFGMWQAPPGFALLGSLTPEEYGEVQERVDDGSILDEALKQLEQRRWVISPSQVFNGRTGIAAPITVPRSGMVVGSMTVSVLEGSEENVGRIAGMLLETVRGVEERIDAEYPDLRPPAREPGQLSWPLI